MADTQTPEPGQIQTLENTDEANEASSRAGEDAIPLVLTPPPPPRQ